MPIIDIRLKKMILIILTFIIVLAAGLFSLRWIGTTLYPLNYKEHISRYSEKYEVDPLLIASIIRAESKFHEKAESHKGARGLMQITPPTGEWIAKEIGITNYDEEMLYNPKTNIMMGCWYISNLKKQFSNNINLVLAAYNGGSGNVEKWLKNTEYSADGVTLYNIPFNETKNYVKRVRNNYKIYNKLYDEDDL